MNFDLHSKYIKVSLKQNKTKKNHKKTLFEIHFVKF